MSTSSPYDKYSSRNKRINILLENFRFFHQPSSDEEVDPKYISRQNAEHQLKNWLEEEKTNHGVYLVTGYRGMGKSSLVGKVLHDLKGKPYYVLKVNLGQENINEKEILRIIAKMLYEKTCEKLQLTATRWYRSTWFCGILSFLIALFLMYILLYLWDKLSEILENIPCEIIPCDIPECELFISISLIMWGIIYSLIRLIQKNTKENKVKEALKKLKNLCTRLNATVSYENGYKLSFKGGDISHKQSQNLESASVQEIEYELIQFLKAMKECRGNDKFVIVLDELDKTEPSGNNGKTGMGMPDYGKVESKPDRHVTSRERRQEVLRIIANMKFFLTTAQAYFIFIAGRELYEAFQADMSDRDFTISSIFTNVLNIDSFLTSSRNANNTALMTEQFICKQLFPKHIKETIENRYRKGRYDKNNPYCLKNYYYYRLEKDKENKKPSQKDAIWRDVLFLYHFTHYLTYISNGSPKKMSMFFEKNVRSSKYLKENGKTESTDMPEEFYLSFGYYTQQKINFIHYLTYPVMQSVINMSNMYGDKLLVSASFLISHLYKYHNNGFSWRNIEQTPELQEINKTPEIREFISSIIDYLNHTHLTTIVCGLYHYKFPMRITEEISFFSKVSNEVSSLFNFSLDQSKALKEHYMNLLAYYKSQDNNPSLYHQESIHHSLGDVYMMEENYSKAIGEYETCVNLVKSGRSAMEQSLNDVLFITRTMLKLGLAHEKRKTDNSAFIVYESLINYLKEVKNNSTNLILFEDIRIMHLAILAKLYVLEKLDTDGIKDYHIKRAINDFNELMQTGTYFPFYMNTSQTSAIVQADFYRKLGDILYYKNFKFTTNPNLKIKSAYEAYIESLKALNIIGQVEYLFEQSFKETDKNNSTSKRDNLLYNIGLVCESLGHVSYSSSEENDNTQETYNETFFEKLVNKLDPSTEDKSIEATNNLERSILYYLAASRYYNASCERNLSSQCYIEIILALSSYMPTIKKEGKVPGKEFRDFLDLMVHFLLICRHRQYEHIHLSEINTLKWMQGREMYEYIELCDLSIAPDIEEIVYAYYTIKLDLAILYDRKKHKDAEKERNSLVRFYKSRLMTGKITCSTLTSSILNQRLKARFNEFLLAELLGIEEDKLKDATLEKLMLFQDRDIFKSPWIKALFQEGEREKYEDKFDVLEFLINDGHFCLSRILEKIIPLRNTTLFNNSFKGDIYYHLIRFTHLYKLLYCYYSYNNASNQDKIDLYLSNCRITGEKYPEGQLIATIKQEINNGNNGNTINVYSVNLPSDVEERRHNFLKKMTYATKRTNPSKTIKVYLAENAIYYYTQAWQVHNQGKSYQLMIRNLHFLDDDLNNNTCQFYMTIERLLIKNKTIQKRIEELKDLYKDSYYYKADSYFTMM